MYSHELADVYEIVYRSRGKDWAAEARDVTGLIRARMPHARSLLDVACGTGAHLDTFAALFDRVEGLEIAEAMRERANERLPDVRIHAGDMRRFALGRRYDAITCMFVAISYVDSMAGMRSAVRCMADHLVPGGVLVIEPWWFPEDFIDGYVAGDLAREGDRTVARISHSSLRAGATHMQTRFVVGSPDGIRQFEETDVMMLFTRTEYQDAFTDAGCSVEFIDGAPARRGTFVGVRSGNVTSGR